MSVLDRPLIDWAMPVVATVVAWQPTGLLDRLAAVDPAVQRSVFLGSSTVMSILAGFTASALFFFAGTDSPRLERFREDFGPLLSRSLLGAFTSMIAAAGCLVAAALAAPALTGAVLFCGAVMLALAKMLRLVFIAYGMLQARYVDSRSRPTVVDDELPPFRRAG